MSPGRTGVVVGATRDIELLREIADLTATGIGLEGVRRILELENQVAALRSRNQELRHRVTELQTALESTLSSLQDRRPNLPALRPTEPISPFRDYSLTLTPDPHPGWVKVLIVSVTSRYPDVSLSEVRGPLRPAFVVMVRTSSHDRPPCQRTVRDAAGDRLVLPARRLAHLLSVPVFTGIVGWLINWTGR